MLNAYAYLQRGHRWQKHKVLADWLVGLNCRIPRDFFLFTRSRLRVATESISSPASQYTSCHYPEILNNVASKEVQFDLTVQLKESLNWPSLKISEYDLEMKIWEVHWKLHELE